MKKSSSSSLNKIFLKKYLKFILFIVFYSCSTFKNENLKYQEKNFYERNKVINYYEYFLTKNHYEWPEKEGKNLVVDCDEKINFIFFRNDEKIEELTKQSSRSGEKDFLKEENNFKIVEYPLKRFRVSIFDDVTISLNKIGWNLNRIPKNIDVVKKEEYNNNTIFKMRVLSDGEFTLFFLRKDYEMNIIYRQVVSVICFKDTFESSGFKREEKNIKERKEDNENKKIAEKLFNEKKYLEAKSLYNKILEQDDNDKEIYYKLGVIEKETGNPDKAIEYFKIVVEHKENRYFFPSVLELLKILKAKKRYSEAIEFYNTKIKSLEGGYVFKEELILLVADLYFEEKKFESAIIEYKRFLDLFPNSKNCDRVLFFLANAFENLKINPDFKEAYKIYKKIITEFPESEYYNLSKSRILYLERHFINIK